MSPRAAALVELMRSARASLDGPDPVEQDSIVASIVADLRARRPTAIAPLSLWPPTERICDPRG
jgi:hypothetical protein